MMTPELPKEPKKLFDPESLDIGTPECTPDQIEMMRKVVRRAAAARIIKGGGKVAPPEAKGVVCDIDVRGTKPIAQSSRRVQKLLDKLYELLKGLLTAGLMVPSNSRWALPS